MDSFNARKPLNVGDTTYEIYRLDALGDTVARLPFCMKVLLENLLRNEDGKNVSREHIEALAAWRGDSESESDTQIAFTPARVILQDFTGVPAIVDLAAMRDAMADLGGDPQKINPLKAVDLVIDHSVTVEESGTLKALDLNTRLEFRRNQERFGFLRWGQEAFSNFRVVPPGTGIVHQVNLEFLADVVSTEAATEHTLAFPDTLVGTDSHTTMINGLGVLGWGVGGIEAEAAMLGQPVTMRIPDVVGFRIDGKLPAGATATDLVLVVTEKLRQHGVVGKFVEFYGDGLAHLTLADRATISNMAPEYGATCGIFPVDGETLRYLELTGRDERTRALVEAYARAQGMWREEGAAEAHYTDTLTLDLAEVSASLAGPRRPQDRVLLADMQSSFRKFAKENDPSGQTEDKSSNADDTTGGIAFTHAGEDLELNHGDVVIAAITSCTNTSNPAVLAAAGIVARNAVARGLSTKPWVKTSLAPGSQVVPRYLEDAGLLEPLRSLGFHVVGFGCTTCIGNSGPLAPPISEAIKAGDLTVGAVLSGNRNFEGRIHAEVKANYLASPPLVVAYALAGTLDIDLTRDPLGFDADGEPVMLDTLWPSPAEISEVVEKTVTADLFKREYADVFSGTEQWKELDVPTDETYSWPESTYIQRPPYFDGMTAEPEAPIAVTGARCLVKVGDSITTDHISPAGAIKPDSPAGEYLGDQGISPGDFNSLGSRRGNHEVMMRGTFANIRLKNQLAPGTEGSVTTHFPSGEQMSIFDAAMKYQQNDTPLIVLAGSQYGTGSSRDWAAKGVNLLGVRAVIAEGYERIHRSNLVGFGVLPLQYSDGDSADSLGLDGSETFSIGAVDDRPETVSVEVTKDNGDTLQFTATVRVDTLTEWDYYFHGGILHYVLRDLAGKQAAA